MTTEQIKATPVRLRIEALDFVRGCALFGILLMNITGMGLPHAYGDPTVAGGATGANLWSWIIIAMWFEGTQRALFSILFGAGIILFTTRLEATGRRDAADVFFRRNLWLIGLGMVNAWLLLWNGDILYFYGIIALFAFAFRGMAPRALLAIGVAGLIFSAGWAAKENGNLLGLHAKYAAATAAVPKGGKPNKEQAAAIADWKEKVAEAKPDAAELAKDIAARRNGYWPAMKAVGAENLHFQSWGLYRYFFDIFSMMMIGMALYRLGVLTLERRTATYVAMMIGGYAIGLTVNSLETRWILSHGFSLIAFSQADITYDLGRLAMVTGHLGTLLLFCRSGILPWVRRSMAAVGQMALTNYLTHSTVALVFFILLGWYGQLERHQLYYVVFAVWAVQFTVSPIWLRHFRFGPVEWLWRSLTYGRKQPFRRKAAAAAG